MQITFYDLRAWVNNESWVNFESSQKCFFLVAKKYLNIYCRKKNHESIENYIMKWTQDPNRQIFADDTKARVKSHETRELRLAMNDKRNWNSNWQSHEIKLFCLLPCNSSIFSFPTTKTFLAWVEADSWLEVDLWLEIDSGLRLVRSVMLQLPT